MSKLIYTAAMLLALLRISVAQSNTSHHPLPPTGDFGDCKVKLTQSNAEITPQVINGKPTFKLAANEFKIEVVPLACDPSIALFVPSQLGYVTQTPLIYGTGSYWMAGSSQTSDILATASGGNPRTTFEEEIELSTSQRAQWALDQYKKLCDSLGYCPTPVKHYATAWPFLDSKTLENRGYANFKRFDEFSPMQRAQGRVIHAVVYTKWKVLRSGTAWNDIQHYILQPHVVLLDFR